MIEAGVDGCLYLPFW